MSLNSEKENHAHETQIENWIELKSWISEIQIYKNTAHHSISWNQLAFCEKLTKFVKML